MESNATRRMRHSGRPPTGNARCPRTGACSRASGGYNPGRAARGGHFNFYPPLAPWSHGAEYTPGSGGQGPAEAFGFDFYGHQDGEILTILELNGSYVMFEFLENPGPRNSWRRRCCGACDLCTASPSTSARTAPKSLWATSSRSSARSSALSISRRTGITPRAILAWSECTDIWVGASRT